MAPAPPLAWGTWLARVALVVVCAALCFAGGWAFGYARAELAAQRTLASYRARTDTVRVDIARLDTVYRADTVRLWRLVRQVDTLVRVDSIPVIAADSARATASILTLRAALETCVGVVRTCEQRLSAERRLRQLAESTAAAQAGRSPRSRGRAFWAGAAAGAGTVLLLRR